MPGHSSVAAVVHRLLVLLVSWAAVALRAAEGADIYGSQPNPMGFHEGARRIVQCDGGHVVGFEVYVSHIGGYPEPTLNALRIVCSSSRILVEHETGSLPDTIIFGNMPERGQPFPVRCPHNTAVAALDWRRVAGTEKDNTARVAGFRVHCGTESNAMPLIVDTKGAQVYPASMKCSGTNNAPAASQYKLTAMEVWYEQLLSGLHLISCAAA